MAIKPVFSFAALVGRGLVLAALAGCSNDVTPAPPGGDGGAGGSSASGQTSVAEQSAATGMSGPAMPAGMDHRTDITFEGKQIQCKLGPLPVPTTC